MKCSCGRYHKTKPDQERAHQIHRGSMTKTKTVTCPDCGAEVWDTAHVDQAINKCWTCGARWLNDTEG